MPELKIGKVSLNTGQSGRSIYPFTNTEGLILASKKVGAEEALSRLRVKVAQMDDTGHRVPLVILDDVLALIDEEMRDGQA